MGKLIINAPKNFGLLLASAEKSRFYVFIDGVEYALSTKDHKKEIEVPDGVHNIVYMCPQAYIQYCYDKFADLPDDDPRKIKAMKIMNFTKKAEKFSENAHEAGKNMAMDLAGGGAASMLVGMAYDKVGSKNKKVYNESVDLDFTGNTSHTLKVIYKKPDKLKSMSLK